MMDTLRVARPHGRHPNGPGARRFSRIAAIGIKRRLASLSPFLATLVLTGAIFLLPATSDRRQAQASAGEIQAYATHIGIEGANAPNH